MTVINVLLNRTDGDLIAAYDGKQVPRVGEYFEDDGGKVHKIVHVVYTTHQIKLVVKPAKERKVSNDKAPG